MEAVEEQSTAVLDSIAAEVARVKADPNSDLASKATNLRIAVAAYGNGISFVEESDASADMGLTKKLGIPLAAALAGVGLAAVAVWIQANRYPVVRNPEALANQRGLAFLGTVATTDGAVASSADRVATEATLLALAGSLRKQPPRGTNSAYVVVLAAGSAEAKTLAVSKFLAEATEAHGALARVIDVDGRHGPLDGIDVQTELSGPRCDLLLFACGTPQKDFTALKLARDADAIVVVVAQNADAAEVTQGLTFFENVGQYPDAVIATKHTKAGR